jgi:4-diphosphocytidyl-2-C-methyl-D-erythritol kinase
MDDKSQALEIKAECAENKIQANKSSSSPHSLILPSFAKINLGLRVLRKRADGYHEIETVFQQISLCDKVSIQAVRTQNRSQVTLETNHKDLPVDSRNLAARAAELFLRNFPQSLSVHLSLQKRIPIGGGLGGGSSNAATVLLAMNRLTGNLFSEENLLELAAKIGADVPFFIRGGLAAATGTGEILTPINRHLKLYIVIVVPKVSISTAWAYTNLKIRLTNSKNNCTLTRFFRKQKELSKWRSVVMNDFESLVFGNYQELKEIKEKLYIVGAKYASLSGSGSALYGIFDREEQAHDGVEFFHPHYSTFLTMPIQSGIHEIDSYLEGETSEIG